MINFNTAMDDEQKARFQAVQKFLGEITFKLDELLPEGREKSNALTRFEEVSYWALTAVLRAGERINHL